MTLWFASYAELQPESSYFHLCPACYGEAVAPHIEEVRVKVAQLHPKAARRAAGANGGGPAFESEGGSAPAGEDAGTTDVEEHGTDP